MLRQQIKYYSTYYILKRLSDIVTLIFTTAARIPYASARSAIPSSYSLTTVYMALTGKK